MRAARLQSALGLHCDVLHRFDEMAPFLRWQAGFKEGFLPAFLLEFIVFSLLALLAFLHSLKDSVPFSHFVHKGGLCSHRVLTITGNKNTVFLKERILPLIRNCRDQQ